MPDPRDVENEAAKVRTDGAELRPCVKCKCPLIIVVGPNGKKIPLDLRTQVYSVKTDLMGHAMAELAPGHHPTHFATCTHASSFGGGKKK